jgi:hypothetical protein
MIRTSTKTVATGKVLTMDPVAGFQIQEKYDPKKHWDRGVRNMADVLQRHIDQTVVLTVEVDPAAVSEREARRDAAEVLAAAATRFVFSGPGGDWSAMALAEGGFGVCRVGSGDKLEPFATRELAVAECQKRAAEVPAPPVVEEPAVSPPVATTEAEIPAAATRSTEPAPELPPPVGVLEGGSTIVIPIVSETSQ